MKVHYDSDHKIAVIQRDGWGCRKCGEIEAAKLSLDHIKPIAAKGGLGVNNLQILCRKCHDEKDKNIGIKFHGGRKKFKTKARNWPHNKKAIQLQRSSI